MLPRDASRDRHRTSHGSNRRCGQARCTAVKRTILKPLHEKSAEEGACIVCRQITYCGCCKRILYLKSKGGAVIRTFLSTRGLDALHSGDGPFLVIIGLG
jgi:hypothetical protein